MKNASLNQTRVKYTNVEKKKIPYVQPPSHQQTTPHQQPQSTHKSHPLSRQQQPRQRPKRQHPRH